MMDDPAEQKPAGVQQPVTPSDPDDGKTTVEQLQQAAEVKIPTPPPSFTDAVKGETKDKKQGAQVASSEPAPQQQSQQAPQPKPNQPTASNRKKISDETKRILLVSAAGLVAGSVIGAVAMNVKQHLATQEEPEEIPDLPEEANNESTGLFDEGLSGTMQADDSLSFGEAFANARQQLGASGIFKWHGKLYGTMYKDEWDNLSDEDRQQYAQQVQSVDLEEDPQPVEETSESSEETSETVGENVQAETDPNESELSTPSTVEEPTIAPNPDYEITSEEGEVDESVDDEEVGEPLDDEEVGEPLADEEVGEPLDDEEIGEPLDDEEVGEPLDDEEVGEPLDDEEVGEPLDDEEEIEDDEPITDEEMDDFEDYENDEDPSAFL